MESEPPRIRDAGTGQASVCSLRPLPPTSHTHLQEMCSLLAAPSLKKDSRTLQAWLLPSRSPHQIVHSSYHQWRWRGGQVTGGIDRARESSRYTTVVWETGSLLRFLSSQGHPLHTVHLCVSYEKALHPGRWTVERPFPPGWCGPRLRHTVWQPRPGLDSSPHLPTRPGAEVQKPTTAHSSPASDSNNPINSIPDSSVSKVTTLWIAPTLCPPPTVGINVGPSCVKFVNGVERKKGWLPGIACPFLIIVIIIVLSTSQSLGW